MKAGDRVKIIDPELPIHGTAFTGTVIAKLGRFEPNDTFRRILVLWDDGDEKSIFANDVMLLPSQELADLALADETANRCRETK